MMWMKPPSAMYLPVFFVGIFAAFAQASNEAQHVSFSLTHPLPAWAWLLIVLACGSFAVWSYSKMIGPTWARGLLACLRTLVLVAAVVLLLQPIWIYEREHRQPDTLLFLLDRSASLQVMDVRDPITDQVITRDQQLHQLVQSLWELTSHDPVADKQIQVYAFDVRARLLGDEQILAEGLRGRADGSATAIRTALETVLDQTANTPISGIVLLTDGQSAQATGSDLVERLRQRQAPIFAVPLGSPDPPADLAIQQVESPARAFRSDLAPVNVAVQAMGFDLSTSVTKEIVVELHELLDETPSLAQEKETSEALQNIFGELPTRLLDRQTRTLEDASQQTFQLAAPVTKTGVQHWQVRLYAQDAFGQVLGEATFVNNVHALQLDVVDEPMGVLYVEGYPRWEYRYVKNLLLREDSINSSTLLLSADRQFAQEGDTPITRFPNRPEELLPYHVIIIGDVEADYFTASEMDLLRQHIASTGAGLIWIGGASSTPRSYRDTALAELLPMRNPERVSRLTEHQGQAKLRPTPLASQYRVFELYDGASREAAEDFSRWAEDMPSLNWLQVLDSLKPGVEVLAQTDDTNSPHPLVTRMRYGAGQVLYVATDDLWRYRLGLGELYHEQIWIQLLRLLGQSRDPGMDPRYRLQVEPERPQVGESVVIRFWCYDVFALPAAPASFTARAIPLAENGSHPLANAVSFTMRRAQPTQAEQEMFPLYEAIWEPEHTGAHALQLEPTFLLNEPATARIEVVAVGDEMRNPQADHDRLATLAEQTNGRFIPPSEVNRLLEVLPDRQRITLTTTTEPAWDRYWILFAILGLLTVEWIGRKTIHLV